MGKVVKKGMSKKAARAAAEKEVSKKKPEKLTKKQLRIAKDQLTGEKAKPLVPDENLKAEATQVIGEIRAEVQVLGNAFAGAVALDKKLHDALDRELWKYCDTPFKNRTAFVNDLKKVAGKSASSLFSMIGLQKALPESTAEQRREIGPRKGMKLAKAAKVAKKKGKKLSPEIIEKAKDLSESQLSEELRREGFVDESPAPTTEIQDDLLHDPEHPAPYDPRKGGSGVIEGEPGTADQFAAVIEEGIEAVQKIYDSEMSKREAMHFVFSQWLKSQCEHSDYEDMTNRAALDHIKKQKKAKSA